MERMAKTKSEGEDVSQLVEHDELAEELQPHLHPNGHSDTAPEYVNPALNTDDDTQANGPEQSNSKHSNGNQTVSQPGMQFSSSTPVVYSAGSSNGDGNVVAQPVVVRQPNGVHVIRTQNCCAHAHEVSRIRHREKPLTQKKIKLLKAFSIVAVFVFFPLGIPAVIYAFKCDKEFHAGILRGNIDLAKKLAKRSERCIIFAVMGALLVAVAVFAIIERNLMEHDEDYWKYRNTNRVLPSGK